MISLTRRGFKRFHLTKYYSLRSLDGCGKARKNGWLSDYTWFKSRKEVFSDLYAKWTHDACMEEAKRHKTIQSLRNASQSCYDKMLKEGWLRECTWFASARPEVWEKSRIPVVQCDLEGNFVKYHRSASGVGICHVTDCIYGKRRTAGGFTWRIHLEETHPGGD